MNRREAIQALTAIPGLTRISRASLQPDDVLVLEVDQAITMEQAEMMRKNLQKIFPNHEAVVLTNGIKLRVLERKQP